MCAKWVDITGQISFISFGFTGKMLQIFNARPCPTVFERFALLDAAASCRDGLLWSVKARQTSRKRNPHFTSVSITDRRKKHRRRTANRSSRAVWTRLEALQHFSFTLKHVRDVSCCRASKSDWNIQQHVRLAFFFDSVLESQQNTLSECAERIFEFRFWFTKNPRFRFRLKTRFGPVLLQISYKPNKKN